ncbi:MAG: preprotein translocase subunit YajC [Magnetococcales bacterium]|nr:preprotein translocase subunit YajC [Magnetococcales bacterium]
MLDLIIGAAHAQASSSQSSTEATLSTMVFWVLLFAIFYFLLIRPQQKQAKQHKEMVENLQRGDSVVTAGGLLGRVSRVEDDVVVLEVGEVDISPKEKRSVRVKVRRATVSGIVAKSVGGDAANDKDAGT